MNSSNHKKTILLFFGMVVVGFFEMLSVVSIVPFMTLVSNPEIIQENEYLHFVYSHLDFDNYSSFLVFSGVLVVSLLLTVNSFNAFMTWKVVTFVNSISCNFEEYLLKKYLSNSYSFFLNSNASYLSKNILSEVDRSVKGVVLPVLNIASRVIVSIFILGMLFIVDPLVASSIFVILGGSYFVIYKLVNSTLKSHGVTSTEMTLQRYKVTNEIFYGIKDIKLKNVESKYADQFVEPSIEFYKNNSISTLITSLPRFLLEVLTFGGVVVVVVFLINSGHSSQSVIPLLSLYALAGYRLMPSLQQIYGQLTQVKYNMPALDILLKDIKEARKWDTRINNAGEGSRMPFHNVINLKSVSYTYPGTDNSILDKIDLDIFKNTTIGLVGPSGSGKTTLVDIILGLLEIDLDGYFIDGTRLTKKHLIGWQQNFGYVSQSIYLSDDTIEKNIAFSVPAKEINHEKIAQVVKLAKLEDLIGTLPLGLKTFVGDRGVRLSGGQRQRIGIARALYFDPEILVLDEATSALDGETESVIMDAIHSLSHKKTIIIIAHRLKTIKECDVIHVLDKGRIVDSGSYEDLLVNSERFIKMIHGNKSNSAE